MLITFFYLFTSLVGNVVRFSFSFSSPNSSVFCFVLIIIFFFSLFILTCLADVKKKKARFTFVSGSRHRSIKLSGYLYVHCLPTPYIPPFLPLHFFRFRSPILPLLSFLPRPFNHLPPHNLSLLLAPSFLPQLYLPLSNDHRLPSSPLLPGSSLSLSLPPYLLPPSLPTTGSFTNHKPIEQVGLPGTANLHSSPARKYHLHSAYI